MNPRLSAPQVEVDEEATHRLTINVASGVGAGPTKLAAFDAALREAGIANLNLIHLSSVVPAQSELIKRPVELHPTIRERIERPVDERPETPQLGRWGDRLYVVLAEHRVEQPHEEAWAGLGWIREARSGRGLFVEHVGHSEAQVSADIDSSLASLALGRPQLNFGLADSIVRGTVCIDEPVCALVAAAFEAEPWHGETIIDLR